jgi:multicomponent Na+:H+ antiporter subunit C
METALAPLVGLLVAISLWLMMTGDLVRFLFGVALVSNAVNLAIFAAGRLTYAEPPLIPPGADAPAAAVANALPQALILTAIVISFGLLAFVLALTVRARRALGATHGDAMRAAEPEDG